MIASIAARGRARPRRGGSSASSASGRCSSSACAPAQRPAMPSWTVDGVFGIARTTGTPAASCRSIAAVGIAAAIESTVCSGGSRPPTSPSSASMSCGLTAMTTSAAPAAASAFESVAAMPWRSRELVDPLLRVGRGDDVGRRRASRRRAARRSAPRRSCRRREPRSAARRPPWAESRPQSPPRRQAARAARSRGRRQPSRSAPGTSPRPTAGHQVDAREALPLPVRREQLGRLGRLDPAAVERGESLISPRSPTRPWS